MRTARDPLSKIVAMTIDLIGYPELLRRTQASRWEIDRLRKEYAALVNPIRSGNYLYFSPETVLTVTRLLAELREKAKAAKKNSLQYSDKDARPKTD